MELSYVQKAVNSLNTCQRTHTVTCIITCISSDSSSCSQRAMPFSTRDESAPKIIIDDTIKQEAQLSPRDRAMRRVN